jgi:DNA-binding NarL/FixJ family response regulator
MLTKIAVSLLAGNRLLGEALARLLGKRGDFDVCGASPRVPEVTCSFATLGADVLVLDSITVQRSECALIPEIVKHAPNLMVILIDMDDDPEVFLECARAGAVGYLRKDAASVNVVSALRSVAQGQAISPSQLSMPQFQTVARQWTSGPRSRIKRQGGFVQQANSHKNYTAMDFSGHLCPAPVSSLLNASREQLLCCA